VPFRIASPAMSFEIATGLIIIAGCLGWAVFDNLSPGKNRAPFQSRSAGPLSVV